MQLIAITALTLALATSAAAQTRRIIIDESDAGTVFDGLVDGFPGLAPHDGTADFGGNPLAVALQEGVTEERAVMEFPLAELAGVSADAIVAATLTFNVDDVIGTFGPGTAFNGRAASTILVHLYDGEGAVTLADFRRTGEPPALVSTGPGAITDATLRQTGAVVFHVDVRARLLQALVAGTPFLGALWRTTDSPTATSIDDGRTGQMPGEGGQTSAGSKLPFLTVEIMDAPPPPCATEGAPCDDGNPCTVADTCTGGVCRGASPCGNGTVEPACGEECDDGNETTADGCTACRHDTLLGGSGPRECLLAVAFAPPPPAGGGSVTCTDGGACDADPSPDRCGFVIAACLGRADARLPRCAAAPAVAAAVVKPGRSGRQRSNRERLDAALADAAFPGCTAPVRIDVPIRRRGKRRRPGRATLVLEARVPGAGRDRDTVSLVCQPAP
jgi:cysteine-rich repeat protein